MGHSISVSEVENREHGRLTGKIERNNWTGAIDIQCGVPDRAQRMRVSHGAMTRRSQQQNAKKPSALRRIGSCMPVRSEPHSTAMSEPTSESSGHALTDASGKDSEHEGDGDGGTNMQRVRSRSGRAPLLFSDVVLRHQVGRPGSPSRRRFPGPMHVTAVGPHESLQV
jgi:hypothetical protein